MDEGEFWQRVQGRLLVEERSFAWLSRRLKMHRQTLWKYASGKRSAPPEVKRKVAAVLGIRYQAPEGAT